MSAQIKELLGNSFTNKAGETLDASALANKKIGIYFSAHWCPPCRGFTPKLAETYNIMKAAGKPFEIVFASSDRDEESFKEYLSEMPWLAIPFSNRDLKQKLSKKFKVQGIPTLVIIDENGVTINSEGREAVSSDPEGNQFPWAPKTFFQCFGQTFLGKDNKKVGLAEIQQNDAVALYFSAHWCGPCRGFTPVLAETYKHLKKEGKKFEVIFVSGDNDEASFKEYYGEMPWLAIPYEDDARKNDLNSFFKVEGIPYLVIIDPKTGAIINKQGRSAIMSDKEGKDFPWKPQALMPMNGGATGFFNETACMIFFADGSANDAQVSELKSAADATAKHFVEQFKKEGNDEKVVFIFATAKEQDLCSKVREFMGLGEKSPLVLIMDIPSGVKFICNDTSAAGMKQFVEDYLAEKLEPVGLQE